MATPKTQAFTLTRRDAPIGRLEFDWDDRADWTVKAYRLVDFTDAQLERKLGRLLERNEPRLKIAGGHSTKVLWAYYEGLDVALWWLSNTTGSFDYEKPAGVPPRQEDPLADE